MLDGAVRQLHFDLEEIAFRLIERHEALRLKVHELPAQFRTDRAAGAGHHNGRGRRSIP